MTEAEKIVDHLLEAERDDRITLADLFSESEPEQYVLDRFSYRQLRIPLPVKEIDPATLTINGHPIAKAVKEAKKAPHWQIVKAYMKDPGPPILVNWRGVWDGHHRAMAAFLAKRPVRAVDVEDLPDSQVESEGDEWKDIEPEMPANYCREVAEEWLAANGFECISMSGKVWHKIEGNFTTSVVFQHFPGRNSVCKFNGHKVIAKIFLPDTNLDALLKAVEQYKSVTESEDDDWKESELEFSATTCRETIEAWLEKNGFLKEIRSKDETSWQKAVGHYLEFIDCLMVDGRFAARFIKYFHGEGQPPTSVFTEYIRDVNSDSFFKVFHDMEMARKLVGESEIEDVALGDVEPTVSDYLEHYGFKKYANYWMFANNHVTTQIIDLGEDRWKISVTSHTPYSRPSESEATGKEVIEFIERVFGGRPDAQQESEDDWKEIESEPPADYLRGQVEQWLKENGFRQSDRVAAHWFKDDGEGYEYFVTTNYDSKFLAVFKYLKIGHRSIDYRVLENGDLDGLIQTLQQMSSVRESVEGEDFDPKDVYDTDLATVRDYLRNYGFERKTSGGRGEWWMYRTHEVKIIARPLDTGLWDVTWSTSPPIGDAETDPGVDYRRMSPTMMKEKFGEKPVQESDDDWKDVSPELSENGTQRWVFTEYELKTMSRVRRCRGDDIFIVSVETDPENDQNQAIAEVQILRNGTVTNNWGDGTYGVPERVKAWADDEDTCWKPSSRRANDNDDYLAQFWVDVYVDENDQFVDFVKLPRRFRKPKGLE